MLLGFLLLVFSKPAPAAEIFTYLHAGRLISMPVEEVEGVPVNDICAKSPRQCRALKIYRGPAKPNYQGGKEGNFSGTYCEHLGGTQLFAHHGKSADIPFCLFEDLSAIDAEKLYLRHRGAKP